MADASTTGDTLSTCAAPAGQRRDARRNRDALLAAAREVFAERGLDVTLDDVARHAGVGVATAYRNFPNKGALVDDLLVEQVGALVRLAEECLEADDAWTGLRTYVEQALERQVADRGLKQLLYDSGEDHPRVDAVKARLHPAVTALVRRAHEAGALRPDVDVTDVPVLNLMLGVVVDLGREASPHLYRRYLELLLDSLRAQPVQPAPLHPPLPLTDLPAAMASLRQARSARRTRPAGA